MSESASSTGVGMSEDFSLKILQIKLLKVLGQWANGLGNLQAPSIDIPDVIFFLQALGFRIKRMDACSNSLRPLGSRVTLACMHSGNRFFLELPQPSRASCKCAFKVDENDTDAFWEVSATVAGNFEGESIIETELLPKIPKEMYTLASYTLKIFVHMINGTLKAEAKLNSMNSSTSSLYSLTSQTATSSPQRNAKRLSLALNDFLNITPTVLISSPLSGADSSARYRSLDMLNKSFIDDTSAKTPLKPNLKQNEISQSSPNIHLATPGMGTSTGGSMMSPAGVTRVDQVSELLLEALSVLNGKEVVNVSQVFKESQQDISNSSTSKKSVSSISKVNKDIKKTVNTTKSTTISKIASACNTKKTSYTVNKTSKPTDQTKVCVKKVTAATTKEANKEKDPHKNSSVPTRNPLAKVTKQDLYSHVKSTIPKRT